MKPKKYFIKYAGLPVNNAVYQIRIINGVKELKLITLDDLKEQLNKINQEEAQ